MDGKHRKEKPHKPIFRMIRLGGRNLIHRGHEIATIVTLHVTALVVIDQSHILYAIGISH